MTSRSSRCQWIRKQPLRLLLASLGARGPHFVRATALVDDSIRPTLSCGSGCEAHFARLGQSVARSPASSGGRHIGSEEPRSWSGRAVRFAPNYPLLVRARPAVDRPDDRTSLRRSKDFRLSQGRVYRPLPAWVVYSPNRATSGSTDVSAHRKLPQCPTVRELRGALAPSTEMSRITIYGADLLERDGRAFHLVPSADHLGGSADAHWARLTAPRLLRAASVRSTSNSDRTGASQ
jgi:hypothetical protein